MDQIGKLKRNLYNMKCIFNQHERAVDTRPSEAWPGNRSSQSDASREDSNARGGKIGRTQRAHKSAEVDESGEAAGAGEKRTASSVSSFFFCRLVYVVLGVLGSLGSSV